MAPAFDAWKAITAQAPAGRQRLHRRRRAPQRRFSAVGRLRRRPAGRHAAHRDAGLLAHHRPPDRRRGLREADRREGLLRHPRGVRRRERAEDQAGDPAGDHGPGRRQSVLPAHRSGSAMVFAPRFSAKRQEITYMVLRPTGAAIYLKNLDTGREEVLGRFPNMTMTMAPRFSPDDSKVAFAAETGRRGQHLCHGPRQPVADTRLTDGPGDRHLAVVLAGRAADRLQLRPRRRAASST